MKHVAGSPGTWSGLAQCLCSGAAFAAIAGRGSGAVPGALTVTKIWILSMGTQFLYSFIFCCVDIHALAKHRDLHYTHFIRKVVIGDWIMAIIAFASATSATGVYFLARDTPMCAHHLDEYKLSIIVAFVAWSFLGASALSTFSLLGSLLE